MNIRQEFEAWAIDHGYDLDESKIFGRLYHCDESIRALQVWRAATSRQEVKIKALVEALTEITELDASDTEEGFNEWGEAFCFGEAKRIAGEALAVKETP